MLQDATKEQQKEVAARERRIKALEREVAKAGEQVEGERDRAAKAAADKAGLQEKVWGRAWGQHTVCVDCMVPAVSPGTG